MGNDNLICSPISNACTPSTHTVVALLSISDEDKINKVVFETKLNILSSLDGREYDLIIGLPDIIKHNLLFKLHNQFGSFDNNLAHHHDRENGSSLRVLQSVSSSETFTGYSLPDKFANLSESNSDSGFGGGLTKFQPTSTHSEATSNSALNTIIPRYGDMPDDMIINKLHVLGNQHHYDEDDEVIQTHYWDDIWQKNDVTDGAKQEDLIATITSKIVSNDPTFKQTIHSFLLNWRDIFSRSLNAVPADLPPLVVEIDQGIFMTRRSQGPPRMMTSY